MFVQHICQCIVYPETETFDLSPRRSLPKFSRDRDETETFDFGSKAETFRTETETFLETLHTTEL